MQALAGIFRLEVLWHTSVDMRNLQWNWLCALLVSAKEVPEVFQIDAA
jgi:hypothetical protein